MGSPLPLETRRAIVRMLQNTDCSQDDAARIFKVGRRSIQRYIALFRETKDVDSHAKFGGHKKAKLAGHEKILADLLSARPDMTLKEIVAALATKDLHVSETGLFFFLKTLGYSNKKNGIRVRAKAQGRGRTARDVQKAAKRA